MPVGTRSEKPENASVCHTNINVSNQDQNTFKNKFLRKYRVFMLFSFSSALIYSGGVIYWASTENRTHFSENALLPGLVDEIFDDDSTAQIYSNLRRIDDILAKISPKKDGDFFVHDSSTLKFLHEQFERVGLETYVQNFSVKTPDFVRNSPIGGKNIFGFVRSSRGYSNEAILIATSFENGNLPALSLMLTLAQFCRRQIFWAKDLIFLLVDKDQTGVKAWLDEYYEKNPSSSSGHFWAHGGAIQAAIILDTSDVKKASTMAVSRADLSINMLNGRLANLDFVNLAIKLLEKHGLLATVYNRQDFWGTDPQEKFFYAAETAARALTTQSSSRPQGLHSFFGSFGIESLTMKFSYNRYDRKFSIQQVAYVLEGVLRSVNNLLEKFHQSYFFYVLFSAHHFAPSAIYSPAIFLLISPLLIKFCAFWLKIYPKNNDDENAENFVYYKFVVFVLLFSHFTGLLIAVSPVYLLDENNVRNFMSLVVGLILVVCSGLRLLYSKKEDGDDFTVLFIHGAAVLELALILAVVSVLNFGLGFVLCLLTVPALICINPGSGNARVQKCLNYVVTFLINPFFLICVLENGGRIFGEISLKNLESIYEIMNENFSRLLFDYYLFSSWQYVLITVGLIPFWICCWISVVSS